MKSLRALIAIAACGLACSTFAAPATAPSVTPVPQLNGGIIRLLPDSVAVTGEAKVNRLGPIDLIVHWQDEHDTARWLVDVTKPGAFEVLITYACPAESADGQFVLRVGEHKLAAKTRSTGGRDFQNSEIIGTIKIDEAGKVPIEVDCVRKVGKDLMALRGVALIPATEKEIAHRTQAAAVPTPLPNGEALSITIDCSEAPEFEDWMRDARVYCAKWYPVVADSMKTDGFTPPRAFNLRLSHEYQGVAATSNTHIFMAIKYVKGNLADLGMIGHEMVHVIQHYKQYRPGWLVEGIADYVRYYVIEPGTRRGRFDARSSDYKRGYQPAAGLIAYISKYYEPRAMQKFNNALRDGSFKDSMFTDMTGETADELWADLQAVAAQK